MTMIKLIVSLGALIVGLGIFNANVAETSESAKNEIGIITVAKDIPLEINTESDASTKNIEDSFGLSPKVSADVSSDLDVESNNPAETKGYKDADYSPSSTVRNTSNRADLGKRSASLDKKDESPKKSDQAGKKIVNVEVNKNESPERPNVREAENEETLGEQSVSQNEEKIDEIAVVDHAPFGQLLKKHVDSKGNVDYAGFKKDQAKLEAYIKTLQANPVTNSQSKNQRLSYWINVYNAFTIKLILDNYPVKSIKDIENGKPWDKLFITLGSTTYSLNDVENNVIRKKFTEPRIHFAVNCAATSCPPLLNDAFYPDKLLEQLDERTRSFLNNSSYNTFTTSKLKISKIFDWYGVDFGDIKSFLEPYAKVNIRNADIEYMEYDWRLNKQ